MTNRDDYVSEKGQASWWQKDGAWHIAIPEQGRDGMFWTAEQFGTREAAIAAIEQQA